MALRAASLVAICMLALTQITGVFALSSAVGHSDVRLNDGHGASCHSVDVSPPVPLDGIETRRYEAVWSWAPPGLVCRTELDGRMVTVHEPTWSETLAPVLWLFGSIAIGAGAATVTLRGAAPGWWRRHRTLAGVGSVVCQPVVAATCLAAYVLPGAV